MYRSLSVKNMHVCGFEGIRNGAPAAMTMVSWSYAVSGMILSSFLKMETHQAFKEEDISPADILVSFECDAARKIKPYV